MLRILFVHGTGVRSPQFGRYIELIQQYLVDQLQLSLHVEGCLWGDDEGVQIIEVKKTIPPDRTSEPTQLTTEEKIKYYWWRCLSVDPLSELHTLVVTSDQIAYYNPNLQEQREAITARIHRGEFSPEFRRKLKAAGIEESFDQARKIIVESEVYNQAIESIPETGAIGNYLEVIARAIVAQAIVFAEFPHLPILFDEELRDSTVTMLRKELGPQELGFVTLDKDKVVDALKHVLGAIATPLLLGPRVHLTEGVSPSLGDILYYQARGKAIRASLCDAIVARSDPVVVLAHSLGGVAAVDLLVEENLSQHVKLLVTVGSQAPYFYAINALSCLERGKSLPIYFPHWINLYDPQDFLSFMGGEIFKGRVQDIKIEGGKPFPQSHGYYWEDPKTYRAILKELHAQQLL